LLMDYTGKIRILSLLLLFFFISMEIDILSLQSDVRLGQGLDAEGLNISTNKLRVSIKPLDVISVLFLLLFILNFLRKPIIEFNSTILTKRTHNILLFMAYGALVISIAEIETSQKLISFMYFIRLFLVFALYWFFHRYFMKYGLAEFRRTIFLFVTIFCVLGILTNYKIVPFGLVINNRSDFYGLLILAVSFLFLSNRSSKEQVGLILCGLLVMVGVLTSGKEGPILALLGIMLIFFIRENKFIIKFTSATFLIALVIYIGTQGYSGLDPNKSITALGGQRTDYSELLQSYSFSFLHYLDRSMIERLAKVILSFQYIFDNFLIGAGFWTSIFVYDFLPDSILQFFMEFGLIGSVLFYRIFSNFDIRLPQKNQQPRNLKLRYITIFILLCGVSFNPIYSFKVMSFLMVLMAWYDVNNITSNQSKVK
jgi:hypothetical protein